MLFFERRRSHTNVPALSEGSRQLPESQCQVPAVCGVSLPSETGGQRTVLDTCDSHPKGKGGTREWDLGETGT